MTQQQIPLRVYTTPWDDPQHTHQMAPGVFEVDTAGHGGIMVHESVASTALSEAALVRGWHWQNWYCYEEDCDWALPIYEHPEWYQYHTTNLAQAKEEALKSLKIWHPDYLENQPYYEILGTKWFCNQTIGIVAAKGGGNDWAAYIGNADTRIIHSQNIQNIVRHGQKLYKREAEVFFSISEFPYRY